MKSLMPRGGNDSIQTPVELGSRIVEHYKPAGVCLEPAMGEGNIYRFLPAGADWCEITRGRDFLAHRKHADWVITNPPFSLFRKFLKHSMEISENIVFLCTINHFFLRARLRDIKESGFNIREIILCDTPETFPQSGFQVGVVHLDKSNSMIITITDWRAGDHR
jgi:hypothetical protein